MELNSPTTEVLLHTAENGKSSPKEEPDRVQLKKELGLIDAIGIIVGIIVGSGIFISSKGVLRYSGSVGFGIVVWTLSGIMSTVGALCYSELGTMILKSGGDYAYLNEAFGPSLAFLYMWSAFIVIMPAGNAVIAITFANYLLKPIWGECNPPLMAIRLIAAALLCLLTVLNCMNVKFVAKIQDVLSLGKVLALMLIICCGGWALFSGRYNNLKDPFEGTNSQPGYIALSFYSGIFSFAGWNYLNFVTEEIKNPYQNLPRAICISLPIVTIIYVLVNVAYYIVLSRDEILSSEAVAVVYGYGNSSGVTSIYRKWKYVSQTTDSYIKSHKTFGSKVLGYFQWLIPVFVMASTFGSLNSNIFTASRLFFVGAKYGHLPKAVALINIERYTPVPSLIFMCILTLILLPIKDVETLINYTTFVESLFTVFSIAGLLWLRFKAPEMKRPIKVYLILPILFFIVSLLLVTLPFFVEPVDVGAGLLIILSGVVVYFVLVRRRSRITCLDKVSESFNIFCAKLFVCAPEESKYNKY